MLKKIIAPLALSALTVTAFAGGPDNYHDLNKTFIGISGGLAANIVESSAQFQDGASIQKFATTDLNTSGSTGLTIGHNWQLSHGNTFGLIGQVNYNFGFVKSTWHLDDAINPDGNSFDLENTVKPRWQYNMALGLGHTFNNNFNVGIHLGPSVIYTKYKLNIIDDTNTGDAGPATSESNYLFGGYLGTSLNLMLTQRSSLGLDTSYFLYSTRDLKTNNNIDTGNTRNQLTKRRDTLSMSEMTLSYNIYF